MLQKLIKLKLTTQKNCFLNIPRSWKDEIQQKTWFYFELTNIENNKKVYLEWSGNCIATDDFVELSVTFATKLGFFNDQEILINIIDKEIKKAKKIIIQPNSDFDWENFQNYSNEIENNLLKQIGIVWQDLILPVWPNDNLCLYLKIHTTEETKLLHLETFTELIGIIENSEIKKIQNTNQVESSGSFFNIVRQFLPSINQNKKDLDEKSSDYLNLKTIDDENIILTITDLKNTKQIKILNDKDIECFDLNKFNTVFVNSAQFKRQNNDRFIGKLTRLLSPIEINNRNDFLNKKNEKQFSLEDEILNTIVEINFKDLCPKNCLIPSNSLIDQLDLKENNKVVLSKLDEIITENYYKIPIVNNLTFSSYETILNFDQICLNASSFLNEYCLKNDFLILNKNSLIKLKKLNLIFEPNYNQDNLIAISSDLKNIEIRILNEVKEKKKFSWKHENKIESGLVKNKLNLSYFYLHDNLEKIYLKCTKLILNSIENFYGFNSKKSFTTLIYGKKGSGKTSLMNYIIEEFYFKRNICKVIKIDCNKIKSKIIDNLKKNLYLQLHEAIFLQPSVLIFENIHLLLPKNLNIEQEHKIDLINNEKIQHLLIELIYYLKRVKFIYGNNLVTIFTSRYQDLFSDNILEQDIFDEIFEIQSPKFNCSIKMIKKLIKSKLDNAENNLDELVLDNLKNEYLNIFETYVPLDLDQIADKIIHSCVLDQRNIKKFIFDLSDFEKSFEMHDSINVKNFQNQIKNKKKFDDLGGLKDVKEKLRQVVHWPTKYPELFKDCPIKPQTCILLYGLPGTGKTSLAEALSNEFKINLISIKGPEILSKYIGASEQAIRELFEKANTSKPCIIFFDEIDSLTPSRGNDNTAVTDRIINQLLTQMDGIESLKEGIYILASTSRPDMIDAALLRPGRFDLCIECKLPNEFERIEILKNLSNSFLIEENIDLSEIAFKTENFTGSDLNALFINTQNEAVNEIIKLNDDLEIENEEEFKENLMKLKLKKKHFEKALMYTFPSLDDYEREKYLKTFKRFTMDQSNSYEKELINFEMKSKLTS